MNYDEILKKAAELTQYATNTYGPVAWDTTLWVVRITNLQILLWVGVWLLIVLALQVVDKTVFKPRAKEDPRHDGWALGRVFSNIFSGVIVLLCLIPLTNVWLWVGLFRPELYLAKQLVDKVM